ncbi:MAG TPA: hypothetical protein PKC28_04540 [Bdellovibrionales bacterium]|nr:hypothetical protein [Bdellovibrionales bacterium]
MKLKGLLLSLGTLTLVMAWNACGNVGFDQATGSSHVTCDTAGADLANCRNTNNSINQISQSYSVSPSLVKEVDVLFVVDNSGSMDEEQKGIGAKINGFLGKLDGLDWQIALTTTDSRVKTKGPDDVLRDWGDGQFRPFDSATGSEFILRSTQVSAAAAQTKLSGAIQVGIKGDGSERGISAFSRALQRAQTPGIHKDFFRQNAALAVVLISDEDECSTGWSTCPQQVRDLSEPRKVIDAVKAQLGEGKKFSFSSIIAIPGDASCTTGLVRGTSYKELTDLTGGAQGSVCSTDFTSPLQIIGGNVAELINVISLKCPATDVDGDGSADLKVVGPNGTVVPRANYAINGTSVSFKMALGAGNYALSYFCD